MNANYFHYDEKIGFNKERGSLLSGFKERRNTEKKVFAYRKDTFIQHTKGLLGAFEQDFLHLLDFPFKAFNQIFNANIDFKKLVRLVLILHDYGKLDNAWQDWMQEYQSELSHISNSPFTFEKGIPLGHTGFNTREEKTLKTEELEAKMKGIEKGIKLKRGGRPPHSGVGAKVIADVLDNWFEDDDMYFNFAAPASIAIARHHGVTNFSYPEYSISKHNYQFIKRIMNDYGMVDIELERSEVQKGDLYIDELNMHERYLLYLFLVRILRLCDQKATDDFEKYLQS